MFKDKIKVGDRLPFKHSLYKYIDEVVVMKIGIKWIKVKDSSGSSEFELSCDTGKTKHDGTGTCNGRAWASIQDRVEEEKIIEKRNFVLKWWRENQYNMPNQVIEKLYNVMRG